MTRNTIHILLSLAGGPKHGYAIKQDIEDRTNGEVQLGAGTLYETIQRLERNGWIREVKEPPDATEASGPRRRFYSLTQLGRKAVGTELESLASLLHLAKGHDLWPETR